MADSAYLLVEAMNELHKTLLLIVAALKEQNALLREQRDALEAIQSNTWDTRRSYP